MKGKLDLNNLLAKYEGISGNSTQNYYSPPREHDPVPIQEQFYQSRNKNPQLLNYNFDRKDYGKEERRVQVVNIAGNFSMSKSECQQFLQKIRQQLRIQANQMNFYAEGAMKKIHEEFKRQHQIIRRQLLDLLDKAFLENERMIRQQLAKQGKLQPPEFSAVRRKISGHEETVDRLLEQLRGPDYKKGIAGTVLHDFAVEINDLRFNINSAKEEYVKNFGEVEPDRQRINCIREDLQKLFRISRKNANLVQKAFFEIVGQKSSEKRGQSVTYGYNNQESRPPERQRKSFFNFGSD